MTDTNIQEEINRRIEDLDSKRREKEKEKEKVKKRHLTKFVISLAWFFFGWVPVLFSNVLSVYISTLFANPQIGSQIALTLIILGWVSIPMALILAIYHLIKWINV
jgi:hypothetical protein